MRRFFVEIWGFLDFWARAVREAFSIGWVVFGTMTTLLPDLPAWVHKLAPGLEHLSVLEWLNHHPIRAHLYFACAAIFIYLCYAPYRLYGEVCKQRDEALKQAGGNSWAEEQKRILANRLAGVMHKGMQLAQKYLGPTSILYPTNEDVNAWLAEVFKVIKPMGDHVVVRVNNSHGHVGVIVGRPLQVTEDYAFIQNRVDTLGELIKELGSLGTINNCPLTVEVINHGVGTGVCPIRVNIINRDLDRSIVLCSIRLIGMKDNQERIVERNDYAPLSRLGSTQSDRGLPAGERMAVLFQSSEMKIGIDADSYLVEVETMDKRIARSQIFPVSVKLMPPAQPTPPTEVSSNEPAS